MGLSHVSPGSLRGFAFTLYLYLVPLPCSILFRLQKWRNLDICCIHFDVFYPFFTFGFDLLIIVYTTLYENDIENTIYNLIKILLKVLRPWG